MRLPIYQVDAFADNLFGGNPAAICPLSQWLPDATMQAIAAENNLAETAFFVREGDDYALRWFTPAVEVDLCGHATLASAHIVFAVLEPQRQRVGFRTLKAGTLTVARRGDMLAMDFPSRPPSLIEPPPGLLAAVGGTPREILRARDHVLVYGSAAEVRALEPDFAALARIPDCWAACATAPGEDGIDFVSRFFAPGQGIDEDPATGSSHCTLTPYWAKRLHKTELKARQLSRRGGTLDCALNGDRVTIAGRAVLYLEGQITL
ncbi:MAG TPA: PhzF family phenazine biosynthesis protein [Xanthobacteraceae bacterium]|nr:PhzF family phenazine biosynthesis protein [Xanthobacteraceae bacterium]